MADTPVSGNTPPATPPAPSPAAPATPSQPTAEESVVLSKEAHAELTRKAAVAETAQKEKAGVEAKLNAMLRRKVAPLPPLEAAAVATVKSQVSSAIIADPKYAPLLQANPTLAKVLAKNPLDILDQDEFVDEQDAANQVLDYLDAELGKLAPAAKPAGPETPPAAPGPKAPNPGDELNPKVVDTPDEAAQKAENERVAKLPPMRRVQEKLAGKIKIS